jgi:hypothetical protein
MASRKGAAARPWAVRLRAWQQGWTARRRPVRVRWHFLVALGWAGLIGVPAVAAEPPTDDRWAFAAEERPEGRPPLTRHRDVAGLLGAMLAGDAAVMFRDPPRFQTLPVEQVMALRVTFAARDAELAAVARLLTRWLRGRVVFTPRRPGDHLTLTLQDVRFEAVVAALVGLGNIQVLAPPARPSQGRSEDRESAAPPAAQLPADPPWVPVHPERKRRLIGAPIGEVCFDGTPPKKLVGKPPELPPSSDYRCYGGVLVAHCLVDDEGYVVEAQLWRTPDPADRQAVARALAAWRFTPAQRRDGRPSAVHFTVTIPIARDRCK